MLLKVFEPSAVRPEIEPSAYVLEAWNRSRLVLESVQTFGVAEHWPGSSSKVQSSDSKQPPKKTLEVYLRASLQTATTYPATNGVAFSRDEENEVREGASRHDHLGCNGPQTRRPAS